MCSYRAISWPTTDGVSAGAMIDVVGRLPVNTRAGTIASAVPSARTSSAVLPKASAAVWAKKLARNSSWTSLSPSASGLRRVGHGDEVGRDQPGALVDQLVEGVLAVGPRLAPEHLAGLRGHRRAVVADALAVGLHGELLQVRREAVQVLRVRQHGVGRGAEEVHVPDVEQAHQRPARCCPARCSAKCSSMAWKPARKSAKFSGPMATATEVPIGGVDRVAAAHPVPEPEGVRRVDAEGRHLVQRRRHRHEVLGDRVLGGARRRRRWPRRP